MTRVLVTDDSLVARRLVSDVLRSIPGVEVVGTAPNGRVALEKVARLNPDLMTCDVEMDTMNGIETVRALRAAGYTLPVVMVSSLCVDGAEATLAALQAGADDYVCKPTASRDLHQAMHTLREELEPRVRSLTSSAFQRYRTQHRRLSTMPPPAGVSSAPAAWRPTSAPPPAPSAPPRAVRPSVLPATPVPRAASLPRGGARASAPPRAVAPGSLELLLIGSSTGGPNALAELLQALSPEFHAPIVVVQHMPPVFTSILARRLDRDGPLAAVEAEDGMPLVAGRVHVAPGGHHLILEGQRLRVVDSPPENSCRPAVDVLFRSARDRAAQSVAVVLTGMGRDGLEGARMLRELGARVLAQDEASSVVWGMPGHVVRAGLADVTGTPSELGGTLEGWSLRARLRARSAR